MNSLRRGAYVFCYLRFWPILLILIHLLGSQSEKFVDKSIKTLVNDIQLNFFQGIW